MATTAADESGFARAIAIAGALSFAVLGLMVVRDGWFGPSSSRGEESGARQSSLPPADGSVSFDVTAAVDAVIRHALDSYASSLWTRLEPPEREAGVDLDVTLESSVPASRPHVRIVQSSVDENIQLVIGSSSLELWWREPHEAPARVQELAAVLRAVAAGRYHERIERNPYEEVVWERYISTKKS
jgi:hypothetical protein